MANGNVRGGPRPRVFKRRVPSAARPKSRGRIPAAVCLLALVLALTSGFSCSGGRDAPGPAGIEDKAGRKPKKEKPDKPGPAPEKVPAPAPPEQPEKPPEPEPVPAAPVKSEARLGFAFAKDERQVFELNLSHAKRRGGKVLSSARVQGSRFLLCAGASERETLIVRENPSPLEEIADGETVPPRRVKDISLIRMTAFGECLVLNPGTGALLVEALIDPVLPATGRAAAGDSWVREFACADGTFNVSFLAAAFEEIEGEEMVRIEAQAAPPGGVPGDAFVLEAAEARYWFSPRDGRVSKAEGRVAYSRGEGEGAEVFEGAFSTAFFGASKASPAEAFEASRVFKAYEAILDMLGKRMFARAEKTIDEFVDETSSAAYANMIDALRRKIPDTRQIETAGLLDRKRPDFLGLKWRPETGAPIYLQGLGEMADGKPRALDVAGGVFPEAWWKELIRGGAWKDVEADQKGKVLTILVWASWVPPCAEAMKALADLSARLEAKGVRLLGISVDTEKKDLDEFLKKHDVKHPTVWDEKGAAVEKFKLPGLPALLVADRQRKIRFAEMGWFGAGTLKRVEAAAEAGAK